MTRLDGAINEVARGRVSRRAMARRVAAAGLLVSSGASLGPVAGSHAQSRSDVACGSQRPLVQLLGEYPYWVARRLEYFGDMSVSLDTAAVEESRPIEQVRQGLLDVANSFPATSVASEAGAADLVSVFQLGAYDAFDIAVQRGNPAGIISPRDLEGKVVAVFSEDWSRIVDPLVHQAGGDVGAVRYAVVGSTWMETLHDGRADAALCWAGLRAQWLAGGFEFDYILGKSWSRFPATSFQIRRADVEDPALAQLYTAYLRGWAMGLEFGHHNPRAAVQIAMEAEEISATLDATFADKSIAVQSMWQLADVYRGDWTARDGGTWGFHSVESWTLLVDTVKEIGQLTDQELTAEDLITNDYVAGANEFDRAKVKADAEAYELTPEFEAVAVPEGAGTDGAYPV